MKPLTLVTVVGLVSTAFVAGCGGSSSSSSSNETFHRSNWDLLATDPDAHKGASVDFVGRVFVTPERTDKGVALQVWEDPQHSENNTIVGYGDPNLRVARDDYVHVVGTVKGGFKGKNAFGAEVTGPLIVANTVDVVDATAAAPPAIGTRGPRSDSQAGITVTVSKVEFAASETRVFMEVSNASGSDASIYVFSMKAVQAGTQYDAKFSSDYSEISNDLVSGASTSGVVVFPSMNPHGDLTLIVEVNSDNSDLGTYGTLRYTFVWG